MMTGEERSVDVNVAIGVMVKKEDDSEKVAVGKYVLGLLTFFEVEYAFYLRACRESSS